MAEDQWQTANLDGSPGFAQAAEAYAGKIVLALGNCTGESCHNPTPASTTPRPGGLQCYTPATPGEDQMGDLNLAVGKSNLVTGLQGWAVDLSDALPGKKNGTEPVTINFRVNGKFGVLPQIVANIKRDDLPVNNKLIPDPFHGFSVTDLPPSLMKGVQKIVIFGSPHPGERPWLPMGKGPGKALGSKQCLCDGKRCGPEVAC